MGSCTQMRGGCVFQIGVLANGELLSRREVQKPQAVDTYDDHRESDDAQRMAECAPPRAPMIEDYIDPLDNYLSLRRYLRTKAPVRDSSFYELSQN